MSENTVVKEDPGAVRRERAPLFPIEQLPGAIEAVLLSLDKPMSASKLGAALGLSVEPEEGEPQEPTRRSRRGRNAEAPDGAAQIERAVEELNAAYEATGRSFRIEKVAGGYRLMTLASFAPVLAAFHQSRARNRLGKAAVETLSIVAYKQPITRAHLEAIRGVACGEVLRSLLERKLVTIKGRAEELGRPILYGTTKEFLDAFGLSSLKDLPTAAELQSLPG